MSITKKLVGDEEERAVSPVIGVILMVAITVILAAVIAAFVLDLGQSQSASASAGVQYDENAGGNNEVAVTYIEEDRTDGNGLSIAQGACESSSQGDGTSAGDYSGASLDSVGDTVYCYNGEDISITATYQGEETTVSTWSSN